MRYRQYKQQITKIVDTDIEEVDQVKDLVRIIHETGLSCSVRVLNGPLHELVKINKIEDERFSFTVIGGNSSLKRTAQYKEIEALELTTDSESMVKFKDKVSRWMLLDPTAIEYNDS